MEQKMNNLLHQTTMQNDAQNSAACERLQLQISEMKARYGLAGNFLAVFTPQCQAYAAQHPERAYTGTAPSLLAVEKGYGGQVLEVFLCMQLEDLNLFASVKTKLPMERQRELAGLIRAEYPLLKTSEVLLFFQRLKCGRYGRFYGAVDALFITTALGQFMQERRTDLIRLGEARKEREKAVQPESNCITYSEYLRRKQAKQATHEE
jgi:hypothetical protein